MKKENLRLKADLWLSLRGLKEFPSLQCKDICKYYAICDMKKTYDATIRLNNVYKNACIKWLDNEVI